MYAYGHLTWRVVYTYICVYTMLDTHTHIPYSAKFSRCIIFAVFADSSRTAKLRLNFPGVRGIVWKQNDSYSTFAVLRGRQGQHGTLSLFQSQPFQILGVPPS